MEVANLELGIEEEARGYFNEFYASPKKYAAIPLGLVLLAVLVLLGGYAASGDSITDGRFLDRGTDLGGGTQIVFDVNGSFNENEVESAFASAGRPGVSVVTQSDREEGEEMVQVTVPLPEISEEKASNIMRDAGYQASVESFRKVSASTSQAFLKQAQFAFLIAFGTMSVIIFYAFKNVGPALAVIFAAGGDILVAAAGMSLLGIDLTLGSIGALLMLIGYSVDTDIVLATRCMRLSMGSLRDRMWSSVKTGVTMSSGGIAGFTLLYLVSTAIVGPSELSRIASVMVIGLLADMPLTWLGNTYILMVHERNEEMLPWM